MIFGIPYYIFWLAVAILLSLVEIVTMGIVTIWFSLGAILAFFVSMLGVGFMWQVIIFILASSIMLYFTRPIVKNYLMTKKHSTNADKLLGEMARVIESIDNNAGSGRVKISGMEWAARSFTGEVIPEGEMVVVKEIVGVKVIVVKDIHK